MRLSAVRDEALRLELEERIRLHETLQASIPTKRCYCRAEGFKPQEKAARHPLADIVAALRSITNLAPSQKQAANESQSPIHTPRRTLRPGGLLHLRAMFYGAVFVAAIMGGCYAFALVGGR